MLASSRRLDVAPRIASWLCACVVALAPAACSDDDPAGPVPSDDGGAADGALPFRCGGVSCPSSPAGTPSCCTLEGAGALGHALENTGRAPNLCGTDIGTVVDGLTGLCLQLEQPGELDPSCPDQVVPAQFAVEGVAPMQGCCSDEGYCGSMETVFPLGCIYATGRKGKRCGGSVDDDGGVNAGG